MNTNPNDPRLTAFALDELDPAERAALEREIAASPEMQSELASIRDAATALQSAFAAEIIPPLAAPGRPPADAAILNAASAARRTLRLTRWAWGLTGVAAGLTLLFGLVIAKGLSDWESRVAQLHGPGTSVEPGYSERLAVDLFNLKGGYEPRLASAPPPTNPNRSRSAYFDRVASTQPIPYAFGDAGPRRDVALGHDMIGEGSVSDRITSNSDGLADGSQPYGNAANLNPAQALNAIGQGGAGGVGRRGSVAAMSEGPSPQNPNAHLFVYGIRSESAQKTFATPGADGQLFEDHLSQSAGKSVSQIDPNIRSALETLGYNYPGEANVRYFFDTKGQKQVCLGNLRGIGQSLRVYSNDNIEWFPTYGAIYDWRGGGDYFFSESSDPAANSAQEALVNNDPLLRLYRQQSHSLQVEIDTAMRDYLGSDHRNLSELRSRRQQFLQLMAKRRSELLASTPNTESYAPITDNPFHPVLQIPLSTFSIDVDTASYSNTRRHLTAGQLPPKDAVRIEELLNYFDYDYPPPAGVLPFSADIEIAACPWSPVSRLVRIGLKGRVFEPEQRPASNLVFLIDVSGSMQEPNKLPLVQQALSLLTEQLDARDTVAMVVYAGNTGLVLPPTPGDQKPVILDALNRLNAGGSTNGGAGIQLAYQTAAEHFIDAGVNRVILATDGDFNVGVTNREELTRLIEEKAKSGVFLSVLGFGMGNLKDATLESLADKGNGNYAYIDTLAEARKVLVDQMGGTLVTIAKDVKIQIEFNPAAVAAYRLIGYENRILAARDFNDDTKDAGEIGAGHTVTALYEIIPATRGTFGVPAEGAAPIQNPNSNRWNDNRWNENPFSFPTPPESLPATSNSPSDLPASTAAPIHSPASDTLDAVSRDPDVDPLRYFTPANAADALLGDVDCETLTLKLRYKQPDGDTSSLIEFPAVDDGRNFDAASPDFQFAAAVAGFGMILRDSPYRGSWSLDSSAEVAAAAKGPDPNGYRAEFVDLVRRAATLKPR